MNSIDRPDLDLVLQVAAQGSLAGAARQLELEPPAVSKRLSALETRLGVRLFNRTTRRLALTEEGELFCRQARQLLDGLQALEDQLQERRKEARGLVRIASSFGFGRAWVAPALGDFQRRHPQVEVQLNLTEQLPDLTTGGVDAAVWLWAPRDPHAVTRKLAINRRVLVAAPDYLARRGRPATPADLQQHACLVVREHDGSPTHWRLSPVERRREARPVTVRVQGALSSNSGEVVRDWTLAGHGIMLRSLWDVHEAIADGRLVHLLPGYAMLDADVHWIAPQRAQGSAAPLRLRLLQDHLVKWFASPPWARPSAGPR
ncbi:LysR substrate-binding domain-containing protein [Aquabacterium sp. A7-Y]|uniref:LysR substrate-binding domain-containing protein n=1 Tax=Aquabacterium sp. A7-Y TaxID=1349605 RepID=UPI00223CD926|nr:LysR substrate-binding domain-containing protein [Aquabacterium sp. A7-Y]MCW7541602.1 LysR substrate-binding domain-containing protein [Aquabacterium sp. A7-Y]